MPEFEIKQFGILVKCEYPKFYGTPKQINYCKYIFDGRAQQVYNNTIVKVAEKYPDYENMDKSELNAVFNQIFSELIKEYCEIERAGDFIAKYRFSSVLNP